MNDLIFTREQPPASDELTVTELSALIRRMLEEGFGRVRVRGELGRVVRAKSGHLYFDIKDEAAVLNVVMWRGQAQRLSFAPEEGTEVIAEGRLSSYPGRSSYQLVCDALQPAGAGALMRLLEERRRRLAAEGLFDPARKRPIPFLPSVIGVVTSPTGAVIRDILHRLSDRFPVRVIVWPALVQGERASAEVAAGIAGFNRIAPGGPVPRPDVIIVARGGGSVEDLWPFNDEALVRAVAGSAIPVISAVGHETDTTLIDDAADLRAPTPTAAAELAVPVRLDLIDSLRALADRSQRSLRRQAETSRLQLRLAAGRLPRPERLLEERRQRLDLAAERFAGALGRGVARRRLQFEVIAQRLRPEGLRQGLERRALRLLEASGRLQPALARQDERRRRALNAASRMLDSLSHASVLRRGFALVRDAEGELVRSAASVTPGMALRIAFADGEAAVTASPADTGGRSRSRRPSPDQGDLF
jgi:exodeoxyribonuclease VII large subunit